MEFAGHPIAYTRGADADWPRHARKGTRVVGLTLNLLATSMPLVDAAMEQEEALDNGK